MTTKKIPGDPRSVAELILLAGLWGGSFLFMRVAAPVLGPIWLIEGRVLLAGLVLLPWLLRQNLFPHLHRHGWVLLGIGCLNSALPFCLLAYASMTLPTGLTAILNATAPLFGTVVATLWWHEVVTGIQQLGLGLGFLGVLTLVGWQVGVLSPDVLPAVGAGLLAALFYAVAAPLIKQRLAGVPPLVTVCGSQLGAAVVLLPLLPWSIPTQQPGLSVIGSVFALALLSTAVAYQLYFRLIQHLGSTRALTVSYLIPGFAMLWGSLLLGEPISLSMLVGCGLIVLGTVLVNGAAFAR
ncbi:MAG: DMT family transporter [Synechococcales cyanobacterium]